MCKKDTPMRKGARFSSDVLTGWAGPELAASCIKAYQIFIFPLSLPPQKIACQESTRSDIQAEKSIHLNHLYVKPPRRECRSLAARP